MYIHTYIDTYSLNEVMQLEEIKHPFQSHRLCDKSPSFRYKKPPLMLLVWGVQKTPKTMLTVAPGLCYFQEYEDKTPLFKEHTLGTQDLKELRGSNLEASSLRTNSHSIWRHYGSSLGRKSNQRCHSPVVPQNHKNDQHGKTFPGCNIGIYIWGITNNHLIEQKTHSAGGN